MARSAVIIQVFVASPSDLASERDILENLIAELNRIWSRSLGVMFELVRWESDTRPAAGADPQSLINRQIPQDYDVFIGMLWGRFGSPTPRALSGTHEEFSNAMQRRESGLVKPEVMVYFKDAAIPPSKIDPEQLRLVQEFQRSLSSQGVLYSTFVDEAGFQNSLRAHLSSLAQGFSSEDAMPTDTDSTSVVKLGDGNGPQEVDLGYLDYLEAYESRMGEMRASLLSIGSATERIGQQMTDRTREIGSLRTLEFNPHAARPFIQKSADDMLAYAEILRHQLPLLSGSRDGALEALTFALVLYEDFGDADEQQLSSIQLSLSHLQLAATNSKTGILEYKLSVDKIPRLTGELNRAKGAVLTQLDSLIEDLEKTVSSVQNVLDSVDRMLAPKVGTGRVGTRAIN